MIHGASEEHHPPACEDGVDNGNVTMALIYIYIYIYIYSIPYIVSLERAHGRVIAGLAASWQFFCGKAFDCEPLHVYFQMLQRLTIIKKYLNEPKP